MSDDNNGGGRDDGVGASDPNGGDTVDFSADRRSSRGVGSRSAVSDGASGSFNSGNNDGDGCDFVC